MANTLEDLKTRRSCRSYEPRQVAEEALQQVLEAGMYAPTGMGKQSPVIVAVQDPETIARLRKMNAAIMGAPEADPFYGAPTVLVVLADRREGKNELVTDWKTVDISDLGSVQYIDFSIDARLSAASPDEDLMYFCMDNLVASVYIRVYNE